MRVGKLQDLGRTIFREAMEDEITGEAAKAAFYFFLSIFPMILALFAFTGLLGGQQAFDWIMERLRTALPGEAASYLGGFVQEVTGRERPGMLSLGLLLSLWAASNVFVGMAQGLNAVYDLPEDRSWWKRRAIALAALVVSLLALSAGAAALLVGPELISLLGLGTFWRVLRWPLAISMLTLMMWLIYYLLPNRDQRRALRPTFVGALVGTGLWLLGTLAFRLYVTNFGSYSKTYGFVGGIIVLLLWLYVTALAILFGGEVAATIEQKAHGERDAA